MKMICDVPDEVIKCIKDGTWCGGSVAEKMIANGIPLSSKENPNKSEIMTGWIPVSERLPDNNVRVLCCGTSKSISGGYTRFVGCCNNGFWFVQTNAETVSFPGQYEVTAWMPLPELYKAEGSGEE